jgi:hypothetical protein
MLLVAGGCFLESPIDDQNIKAAKARAETQRMIAEYQRDSTRVALEMASDRAAAHADSVVNHSAIPDTSRPEQANVSAAKVAAVMQANDITLPQVAAWLNTYGFDVINRAEFREWTWTPAPAGTNPIDGREAGRTRFVAGVPVRPGVLDRGRGRYRRCPRAPDVGGCVDSVLGR